MFFGVNWHRHYDEVKMQRLIEKWDKQSPLKPGRIDSLQPSGTKTYSELLEITKKKPKVNCLSVPSTSFQPNYNWEKSFCLICINAPPWKKSLDSEFDFFFDIMDIFKIQITILKCKMACKIPGWQFLSFPKVSLNFRC